MWSAVAANMAADPEPGYNTKSYSAIAKSKRPCGSDTDLQARCPRSLAELPTSTSPTHTKSTSPRDEVDNLPGGSWPQCLTELYTPSTPAQTQALPSSEDHDNLPGGRYLGRLPTEVRLKIYSLLMSSTCTINLDKGRRHPSKDYYLCCPRSCDDIAPLPAGWERKADSEGKTFYYDSNANTYHFSKPRTRYNSKGELVADMQWRHHQMHECDGSYCRPGNFRNRKLTRPLGRSGYSGQLLRVQGLFLDEARSVLYAGKKFEVAFKHQSFTDRYSTFTQTGLSYISHLRIRDKLIYTEDALHEWPALITSMKGLQRVDFALDVPQQVILRCKPDCQESGCKYSREKLRDLVVEFALMVLDKHPLLDELVEAKVRDGDGEGRLGYAIVAGEGVKVG